MSTIKKINAMGGGQDKILITTLLLWIAAYAALSSGAIGMDPMPHVVEAALRRLVCCLCGAGLSVLLDFGLRLSWSRGWPTRIAVAIGGSMLAAFAYSEVNYAAFYLYRPLWGDVTASSYIPVILNPLRLIFWVIFAGAGISLSMRLADEARQQAIKTAQAEADALQAQNLMLRYQINPHFLFNALNALSNLVLNNEPKKAEDMILAISDFYRLSLQNGPEDRVPLARELSSAQSYISVEQVRFRDRLVFTTDVPRALTDVMVPSLILQPLLENAVKHGIGGSSEPVTIAVSAREVGANIQLSVTNSRRETDPKKCPPGAGVGLKNVERRLEQHYGRHASLTVSDSGSNGFQVILTFPAERD